MQLSLGFSPCPNDTFILEALLHKRVESPGMTWEPYIEDVETLNQWAQQERLDITKMSFAAWLRVQDKYDLLSSGAALGHGCGPLVISREPLSTQEISSHPVAIPGALTTANLLFTLKYPDVHDKRPMLFSEIESAVLSGAVRTGVIIHENRFTYADRGLVRIVDLGAFWEELTGSPIPLGAFAIRKSLGVDLAESVSRVIRESVVYGFEHRGTVMPFVRRYAQEMAESVMEAHINTYVNEFSLDIGSEGLKAIRQLRKRASAISFS